MNLSISELNVLSAAMRRDLKEFQSVEGGIINTTPNRRYLEKVRKNIVSFEFKLRLLERIQEERELLEPGIDDFAISKSKEADEYRRSV